MNRDVVSAPGIARLLVFAACVSTARPVFAQNAASAERTVDVSAAATVTNKGISLIPSFTLGRPAAIFDLSVRAGDLSFEPQFRFGLDGKPWSFLLWGRYRAVTGDRFRLVVGGHPSYSFRTIPVATGGVTDEVIQVRRYVAGEVAPSYRVADDVSIGAYYLYSHGLDPSAAAHTHFVAARASVPNLARTGRYAVNLAPQLYYLRTDGQEGIYLGSGATLARQGLPVSISTTVNLPLRSGVAGGQDFIWNVSLSYVVP